MSASTSRKEGLRRVNSLARKDHEQNCPEDQPYERLSHNHQHVHESVALRQLAREKKP